MVTTVNGYWRTLTAKKCPERKQPCPAYPVMPQPEKTRHPVNRRLKKPPVAKSSKDCFVQELRFPPHFFPVLYGRMTFSLAQVMGI